MNEILFRAQRCDNKEWVEGFLFKMFFRQEVFVIQRFREDKFIGEYEVIEDTIGQYTGLTDKNGKNIFKGNITKLVLPDGEVRYFEVDIKTVVRTIKCHPDFDDEYAKVEITAVVLKWNGYELFPCVDENGISDIDKMEVVGNVYDNPEVLKGDKYV
ncbi:MAG: YopX family protein [Selenomonadaceae bacterium]